MTGSFKLTVSPHNSTPDFDSWFEDEREPLLEKDVDETVEDDYSDNEDKI
jgi:subtilase family serine protease